MWRGRGEGGGCCVFECYKLSPGTSYTVNVLLIMVLGQRKVLQAEAL